MIHSMDWHSQPDAAAVEAMVRRNLPEEASIDDVRHFLKSAGLEHSELTEGVIHASAPARSDMPLINAKWLLKFFFENGRLIRIEVKKGLTGP